MALCEGQLDSVLPQLKREESSTSSEGPESPQKKLKLEPNGDIYGLNKVAGGLPLSVDYRSPVSHFVPPAVELYAARHKTERDISNGPKPESSSTPAKRKRGRPRIDKTSPEYLANVAARKQAKEMAAVISNRTDTGEKRKRGRPRVDKTSPEYLARKRIRELEALEKKAKREYRRRTGDSVASSSAGDSTPRVKRKYTKRTPSTKKNDSQSADRVKGKRGRPRKIDQLAAKQQPTIRVRSNLMPNSEPIPVDSDDEPDLGSPSQASDSLSLDENLRALRHIHEKYANIDKDEMYEAHLLAANFKKPADGAHKHALRNTEGGSVKEMDTRTEKIDDSSNSDSDSSTSGSCSSSSGSSSSSSSGSSSSSDSSDSESDTERPAQPPPAPHDDRSFGAWSSYSGAQTHSGSESNSEDEAGAGAGAAAGAVAVSGAVGQNPVPIPGPETRPDDDISESENESADKSFQCYICRKWYSTRVTLKIHRRVHQSRGGGGGRARARCAERYECDCCSDTFSRRDKLREHKAEAHRGSMTVRCEVCRKCFEDEAELAAHDAAHTADERAGRCDTCGAQFPRYEQLSRHRQCAHGALPPHLPHACAQCGKRFSHAHSLTRHMHNHAKQLYRCVVCKASFARADQLAQHLNSHLANYKRMKP